MSFTTQQMKPYAARMAAYGFFVVLSVVFTMATALSVADFVKILFPQEGAAAAVPSAGGSLLSQAIQQLYDWLIAYGPQRALIFFALIVFGLYALKNIFGYLSLVQMAVIRAKVVHNIRNQLFDKVMRLPLSYFGSNRKGDVL
jgi:subfamily B ATP-binding cassette protein MsbA